MSLLGLSGAEWGFLVAGGFAVAGAVFAVAARRTFHGALGLGVTLIAMAFLFILLGSPLLGVVQVLVYVGGILTLLVFAIMFVTGDEAEDDEPGAGASKEGELA